MFIIEEGRVEISVTTINGRKSILENLGPGEILGEIAMFDGGERSADAAASTAVSGLTLGRQDVAAFLADQPDAAMAIIAELCMRIRLTNEIVEAKNHIGFDGRNIILKDLDALEAIADV